MQDISLLEETIRTTQIAVELMPEPGEVPLLCKYGELLDARFELKGHNSDLNEAISTYRRALEITPEGTYNQLVLLERLGGPLLRRFDRIGDLDDLEGATEAYRRLAVLTPDDDSDLPVVLSNYANTLRTRFTKLGDTEDINRSVATLLRAVELTPMGHPNERLTWGNLGVAFLLRFDHTSRLEDLQQSISALQHAVEIKLESENPSDELAAWLSQLAFSMHRRFDQSSDLDDLENCISLHRRGIELTPEGHPYMRERLYRLSEALNARIQSLSQFEDLEDAVLTQCRVMSLMQEGHLSDPRYLQSFSRSLLAYYERTGDIEDLDGVVALNFRVLEILPDGHSDTSTCLFHLGNSLRIRFECTGIFRDLEDAIVTHRHAVAITPEGSLKPIHLDALGICLGLRFNNTGDLQDLETAIAMHRRAVDIVPDNHPQKPMFLSNLGSSYATRFGRISEPKDLDLSIALRRRALELTPDGTPEKATIQYNLGVSLTVLFKRRTKHPGDLEDATMACRSAIELTPDGHRGKPGRLLALCHQLSLKFELTSQLSDIEAAISAGLHALDIASEGGRSEIHSFYNALSYCLHVKYKHEGDPEILRAAIDMIQKAVAAVPNAHPSLSSYFLSLGIMQELLCDRTQTRSDFDAASQSYMAATLQSSGRPIERFGSALRCGSLLYRYPAFSTDESFLSVYAYMIETLPEIVWLGHSLTRRFSESYKVGEITNAAVSTAIITGRLPLAMEWFEAGRALIWTQVLSLRTPTDELQQQHPLLAENLRKIQRDLQQSTVISSAANLHGDPFCAPECIPDVFEPSAGDRHRQYVIEYESLLKEIRTLAGFNDFLLPKTFDNIIPTETCFDRPVVCINVDTTDCHALIISSGNTIRAMPLPELTLERAGQLRSLWTDSLAKARRSSARQLEAHLDLDFEQLQISEELPFYRHSARFEEGDSVFYRLLEYLWRWIVRPVLQAARITARMDNENPTHVTWCPTGPLTQLPLHAAGIYSEPDGPRAYDFVVSSYIPSLSALVRCSTTTPSEQSKPSALIVTQPETPGNPKLPGTKAEGVCLRAVLNEWNIASKHFDHDQAKVESVRSVMDQYTWVHLACHGSQNRGDATQSAFALYDGPLSLLDLMRTTADNAELAFLSACQTATGDAHNPEESAHLAAGMLAVGFKGVVATMWSIQDADAPVIVEAFYKELLAHRSAGAVGKGQTGAAYALHKAVKVLRESPDVGEDGFMRWVPFVHFGV